MTGRPWEPDRPLDLQGAAATIAARFPELRVEPLRQLGSGWEFDAYATADGWVFRFPRRAESATHFDAEARIHRLVADALPGHVALPVVELIGSPADDFPYPIAGHRFIPGIPADTVEDRLLEPLARDIGTVLGALHSIPETPARRAGIREGDPGDEGGWWLETGRASALTLRGLDPVVDAALDWFAADVRPVPPPPDPLRVIHQDLSPEHLLVDRASGAVAGILDWTDTMLGDAARDFAFLATWRGWAYVEQVLRSYRAPVDAGFRGRLDGMARQLSLLWLGHAHEQGIDLAMHLRWVRNVFGR